MEQLLDYLRFRAEFVGMSFNRPVRDFTDGFAQGGRVFLGVTVGEDGRPMYDQWFPQALHVWQNSLGCEIAASSR